MTIKSMLFEKLTAGEVVVGGWSTLGQSALCELYARAGYSAVTLDTQHGQITDEELREAVVSLAHCGVDPVMRIRVGDFAKASWALDLGVHAIIAPMINTVEDAKKLVEFTKYPPVGARSYGPLGAARLQGTDEQTYFKDANSRILCLAMIESEEALCNLDDIIKVEGLDGVFVGPSDLSISITSGVSVDPFSRRSETLHENIAEKAVEHGKIAGIYAITPKHARDCAKAGYTFICYGTDVVLFNEAASAAANVLAE
ncbi:HpcH/HpaI aldolase family protein [Flexibacterium corallicola]|uniref:HpcH/HpaI aldolase family protein n=1 Tax=Flexibacterium corallicola TaxID=3037259 RepID=UPI00286F2563|nr:aldolase/citrate lyase family protein [Pseudovibrio sp. M1P-2-3]